MLKRIETGISDIYLSIGVKLQTRRVLPILEFAVDLLAN